MRDTRVLQPLLVSVGLTAADLLFEGSAARADVLAGHSVGELTAMTLAGVVDHPEGVRLAALRGAAMAAAAAREPTGMAAVIGADQARVQSAVASAAHLGLRVATRNSATQVVLAGPRGAIDDLTTRAAPGVRVVGLEVAGAFHTEHMRSAVAIVHTALGDVVPHDPTPPVVSNLDGALLRSGQEVLRRVPEQVEACVRWDLCQRTLHDLGVTGVLELPPAGTLAALARHALPGVERFALSSPAELVQAGRFVARHTG